MGFLVNLCGQRQQQNSVFARINNFRVKITVFPKIMTILTDLAISNSMSSFVPKYWLNWQILVAMSDEFRRQRFTRNRIRFLPGKLYADRPCVHTFPSLSG